MQKSPSAAFIVEVEEFARLDFPSLDPVWPENSIYLKQREIIPGVVDKETTRYQSSWTRSAFC